MEKTFLTKFTAYLNNHSSMKNKALIQCFVLFVLHSANLYATHEGFIAGARQTAMSSSGVTSSDMWSVLNNQAGLGFLRKPSAGFFIENRFLMKELSFKSAGIAIPVSSGTFGLGVSHFGYSAYSEIKAGLGFGKTLGENFSAGVRIDYLYTRIGDVYGKSSSITFEAGILANLSEKLILGAHVFNPVKTKLSENSNEIIPLVFNIGVLYMMSDQISITAEIEKSSGIKTVFRTGFEYQPAKAFFIRGGLSTRYGMYSFGAGIVWNCFKIDFSSSYHQTLGFSPQFSLIYELCKQ